LLVRLSFLSAAEACTRDSRPKNAAAIADRVRGFEAPRAGIRSRLNRNALRAADVHASPRTVSTPSEPRLALVIFSALCGLATLFRALRNFVIFAS